MLTTTATTMSPSKRFNDKQKEEINQALTTQKKMLDSKKEELACCNKHDQEKFKKAFGKTDQ